MLALKNFFIVGVSLTLVHCSSNQKSLEAVFEEESYAQELRRLESKIAQLNEQIEDSQHEVDHEEGVEESEEHSHEHGHEESDASLTEIEILKLLQKLNNKIMILEQKLAQGKSQANDEVIKRQVMEMAQKTLAEHPDVGQNYITNPNNIVIQKNNDQAWQVKIRFKINAQDPDIYNAQILCFNENNSVTCRDLEIEAE
ncbi:MAG TPA: hypothetical protein PKC21_07910 [Oligoflexia bacterium]|nr:hypothetical protein [Oligoflexia bacterium]HMR25262.1 hypothetical protein [Oligoflexia bacterium]